MKTGTFFFILNKGLVFHISIQVNKRSKIKVIFKFICIAILNGINHSNLR